MTIKDYGRIAISSHEIAEHPLNGEKAIWAIARDKGAPAMGHANPEPDTEKYQISMSKRILDDSILIEWRRR